MSILRWIFISFPLLLILLATLFWGLLHSIDREVYRQLLETEISRLTGRAFQVEGALGVELLPRPALVAGGVSLANAPWGSRKKMLELGHLRMELALRPLLDGRISITRIVVSELQLLLERSPENKPNWHFESHSDGAGGNILADGFALWDIHQVLAHKARLTINDGDEPLHIQAEALRLRALNRSSPLEVYLKGEVLERNFIFSGAIENMSRLLANEVITLRGKAIHGSSELRFQGELEQPLDMGVPRLTLSGEGPALAEILPDLPANIAFLPYQFLFSARTDASKWIVDGIRLEVGGNSLSGEVTLDPGKKQARLETSMIAIEGPELRVLFPTLPAWIGDVPYQLSVMASGDITHWNLRKLQFKVGENRLTGDLTVDRSGKRPLIAGELHATLLQLPDKLFKETDVVGESLNGDDGLFSTEEIDSEALSWVDGNLTLQVESLKSAVLPINNLHARLQLEDGYLQLTSLQLAAAGGTLTASGSIHGAESGQVALKASGKKLDLLRLADPLGLDADELSGKIDFTLDLNAHGRSPATLAKSLNGDVKLLLTDGRVRAGMHEYLVGGLSTILGAFFSKQSDTSTIHCAVAHMHFQQGRGESRLLVVDTEHSLLKGKGKLDLQQESLDFLVEPKPKGVTLNLGVPMRIHGPIREPVASPQALGAARKIGGLLGIIFFPPAALLGLGELGAGEAPACSKALGANQLKEVPPLN